MNTMTPHGSKVGVPVITCLKRFKDRGFKKHTMNEDGTPNTQLEMQKQWEAMYTGPQIATFFIYA